MEATEKEDICIPLSLNPTSFHGRPFQLSSNITYSRKPSPIILLPPSTQRALAAPMCLLSTPTLPPSCFLESAIRPPTLSLSFFLSKIRVDDLTQFLGCVAPSQDQGPRSQAPRERPDKADLAAPFPCNPSVTLGAQLGRFPAIPPDGAGRPRPGLTRRPPPPRRHLHINTRPLGAQVKGACQHPNSRSQQGNKGASTLFSRFGEFGPLVQGRGGGCGS